MLRRDFTKLMAAVPFIGLPAKPERPVYSYLEPTTDGYYKTDLLKKNWNIATDYCDNLKQKFQDFEQLIINERGHLSGLAFFFCIQEITSELLAYSEEYAFHEGTAHFEGKTYSFTQNGVRYSIKTRLDNHYKDKSVKVT